MFHRLDILLQKNRGVTRAVCQKFIKRFGVRVNGKLVKKSHVKIREGDEVAVNEAAWTGFLRGLNEGETTILKEPYSYIHQGKSFFIVDKPAGVRTESFLKEECQPVHRLDKDTSGVLVMAKTAAAKTLLQKQWQDRSVKKTYTVLVKGRLVPAQGAISAGIARSLHDRKKMAVSALQKARSAYTEYKVIKYFPDATLLCAFPHTGRTHQIRVHFASIGHPVLGDSLYGDRKINEEFEEKYGLNRQFLHASSLTLKNPETKKRTTFKAPLSEDLRKVLESLKP